jgi:uracil-DNA glycosylase
MNQQINPQILQKTEELVPKLQEIIKQTSWYDVLKFFVLSEDFNKIVQQLVSSSINQQHFTPTLKQVFRVFQETDYRNVRVVIIGQDPYPQVGVADGISFSCSNTMKPEASLRYIHGAIRSTVYDNDPAWTPPVDLSTWSKQGVLMLNTAFTVEVGKIGSHYHIWKNFTTYLLDQLAHRNTGLVVIGLGNKAKEFMEIFPDETHHKLFATHPASAAYSKQKQWDCNDVFNQTNHILKGLNGDGIVW